MVSLTKKPLLDRRLIQDYVGLTSFQRGEKYAHQQAIVQGKYKNHVVTAFCQGHEFDPYRVEVIFNAEGKLVSSYCSCPVGAGGKCKHIAALLLTWVENPDVFTNWEKLKEQLSHYDSAALVELIDCLDDKVKNSAEVIQAFQQNLQLLKSARLAKYFQRVEEAFHVSEFPWYHPDERGLTEIAFTLGKINADVEQLIEEGQWEEVIRISQTLVQQILLHLDEHLDPWESLEEVLKGCIHHLDCALEQIQTQPVWRQKIFQILFRLIEEQLYREISIGAEAAKEVLLRHVHADEREKIIAWVEAIQTHPRMEQERHERGLEDFLIDLQKATLEPSIYLKHYRQTGQIVKLVESLLELGQIEEAQQEAQRKEFALDTLALAHLFVKYQCPQFAEKLVLAYTSKRSDVTVLRWLKEFYQQQGAWTQALEQAKKILYLSPQFAYYQDVQELAKKQNIWPVIRREVIEHLQKLNQKNLLIEIYLDEKNLEKAMKALTTMAQQVDHYVNSYYLLLALRVAAAVRHQHPQFALKIYQEVVEHLIEERNRESYQRACDHLQTIRSIYQDLQQVDQWNHYLKALLQTYRRLTALKDELYQAQLMPFV